MKQRWKIILVITGIFALVGFLGWRSSNRAQTLVEQTRRKLRDDGFKLDLKEFNLISTPELRARAATITNASLFRNDPRFSLEFMVPSGSNAARVTWQQASLKTFAEQDVWDGVRPMVQGHRATLDMVCAAVLAGPIQFEPLERFGNLLAPYLAKVRNVSDTLSIAVALELHDGNTTAAWTRLAALTRLVSAWTPEPIEVSHQVRFRCAITAYRATWEALQTNAWTGDQLAALQREWESVDYFGSLPQTAALSGASMVEICRLSRLAPVATGLAFRHLFPDVLRSPRLLWSEITGLLQQSNYRHSGSFEDESDLMLYFRDRELDLQRAAKAGTWSQMRNLSGASNSVAFKSKYGNSGVQAMMNMNQISRQVAANGLSLMAQASNSEGLRRLVITALALERYQRQHGAYPASIEQLVPALLKTTPVDFMDGKPMRYQRLTDGHFVLYSVGLDCEDNEGKMPPSDLESRHTAPVFGIRPGLDLVWPRPATPAEVEARRQADEQTETNARAAIRSRYGLLPQTREEMAAEQAAWDKNK